MRLLLNVIFGGKFPTQTVGNEKEDMQNKGNVLQETRTEKTD
jgi:hypothetical protein